MAVDSLQTEDEKVNHLHHHLFVPYNQTNIFLVLYTNRQAIPRIERHLIGQLPDGAHADVLAHDPEAGGDRAVYEFVYGVD